VLLGFSSLPELTDPFLFSDDYYWFDIQHSRPWDASWEVEMMTVMNGRPLHGVLWVASFPWLAVPYGWIALRMLGIASLLLTVWVLARALRRVWDAATADWVATAVMALPGFTLFTFWVITVPNMLAATCGVIAAELALEGSWKRRLAGAAVLMLGLANYQPFALVYFALLALIALTGELAIGAYAVGIAAIGVYYVFTRLSITWFELDMAGRGELAFRPLEKARWLATSALPFASKLWSIALPPAIGLAALAALAAACSYRLRHRLAGAWRRVAFVAVAGATTILPHLSVRETATRWRTLLPLSVLLALLVFAALQVRRWPRPMLAGVVVALLLLRAYELERFGVAPERAMLMQAAAELTRIRGAPPPRTVTPPGETSLSAATDPNAIRSVFVLRPGRDAEACAPRFSDDEFTAPSSQHDFATLGIVRAASLRAGVPMPTEITHGTLAAEAHAAARAGVPVIDLRVIPDAICARASRF